MSSGNLCKMFENYFLFYSYEQLYTIKKKYSSLKALTAQTNTYKNDWKCICQYNKTTIHKNASHLWNSL
jgi:hypothetical protein